MKPNACSNIFIFHGVFRRCNYMCHDCVCNVSAIVGGYEKLVLNYNTSWFTSLLAFKLQFSLVLQIYLALNNGEGCQQYLTLLWLTRFGLNTESSRMDFFLSNRLLVVSTLAYDFQSAK
jgi:hypothetical protein